jgi:hypothetical protein
LLREVITSIAAIVLMIPPIHVPEVTQVAEASEAPEAQVSPPPPQPSPPAPKPVQVKPKPLEHHSVREQIMVVFGPAGTKAVKVFWCESCHRPDARNGQYRGVAQLGARERARFGHGPDSLTQIRAAYEYFKISHWGPWKACL